VEREAVATAMKREAVATVAARAAAALCRRAENFQTRGVEAADVGFADSIYSHSMGYVCIRLLNTH